MSTQFNIDVTGKGKILGSFHVPAPNNDKQNWWKLTIQNGPTTFLLTVPTERSREATIHNQRRFATGNVIYFKATLDKDNVIALSVHRIDPHLQGRLDL